MFIKSKVNQNEINAIIDTGSSITIINKELVNQEEEISDTDQPLLTANGSKLIYLGKCKININIGTNEITALMLLLLITFSTNFWLEIMF